MSRKKKINHSSLSHRSIQQKLLHTAAIVLTVFAMGAAAGTMSGCSKRGSASTAVSETSTELDSLRSEIQSITLPDGANSKEIDDFNEVKDKVSKETRQYGLEVIRDKLIKRRDDVQARLDKEKARSENRESRAQSRSTEQSAQPETDPSTSTTSTENDLPDLLPSSQEENPAPSESEAMDSIEPMEEMD